MELKRAVRRNLKARIALIGVSGSGKTYTALLWAHALGERIAVIDTEDRSASKFAGRLDKPSGLRFDFDVIEIDHYDPETYMRAIELAEQAGIEVLVVDSLSHAWMGRGGMLEQADRAARRSNSGNSFTAWRDVTPQHNALVEALKRCKMHLIVTMRAKTEYVIEDVEKNGRITKVPRKIGLAPVQRAGLEYEFDLVGDLDTDHVFAVTKSRCEDLDGAAIPRPGPRVAQTLLAWLNEGEAAPADTTPRTEYDPGERPTSRPNGNGGPIIDQDEPPNVQADPRRSQLIPPTRVRKGKPERESATAPTRFSTQASWPLAGEWNGRPLRDAPLAVLLTYSEHVQLAAAVHDNTPLGLTLRKHLGKVQAVITAKEPSMELGPDPAGLGPGETCETCPANPQCAHYSRCLDAIDAELRVKGEAVG